MGLKVQKKFLNYKVDKFACIIKNITTEWLSKSFVPDDSDNCSTYHMEQLNVDE